MGVRMLDLVDKVLEKLRSIADELNGSFYEPFVIQQGLYVVVVRGKIEVDKDYPSIMEVLRRRLRIVEEVNCGEGCVLLLSAEELPVALEVAEDCAKVPYRVYVPILEG